jgi:hypothetical protein
MTKKQSDRVGELPRLLTKKEICVRLGISLTSRRRSLQLRRDVFTDDVLRRLGLSEEEYKQRKNFTCLESNLLAEMLQL